MQKSVRILGISAFYHDSAAALIVDGKVISAAQEERFTRIKHDESFPINSINWIIEHSNISAEDIDYVVFYEKPFVRFERLLETYLAFAPVGFSSFRHSMPRWIKDKLFQKSKIIKSLKSIDDSVDWSERLHFSDHHLSHASSAFYPSPFEESAIVTIDGVGEWATTTIAVGTGSNIEVQSEMHFPHSIGLLYSTITAFLGFKVNSGEYKVMGLAPYGTPIFTDLILENLIHQKEDSSYRLNLSYFSFATDVKMASTKMAELFGIEPRQPEAELKQIHKDIAASLQKATETVLLRLCAHVAKTTGMKHLCLAGGVALNCVANEKIRQAALFDSVWVQPAAGDAGGAIGAALALYHMLLERPRSVKSTYCTYLGPEYSSEQIGKELDAVNATYRFLTEDKLIEQVTTMLAQGHIIGWMQGRAEFGPRALGNRSILADPRVQGLQSSLNLKIKFRESFRPFAPSILEECTAEWFDSRGLSTYMGFVANAHKGVKEKVSSVVHLDGTARLQTVSHTDNPLFHRLLASFHQATGCPLLVNTSFNVRGEPMVLSPLDAFECFMGTGIDVLVVGNYILCKSEQSNLTQTRHVDKFILD